MNSALELMQSAGIKAETSKECWLFLLENFEDALKAAVEKKQLKKSADVNKLSKWLLSQAFTIRQLSRFVKDKAYYSEIRKNIKTIIDEQTTDFYKKTIK